MSDVSKAATNPTTPLRMAPRDITELVSLAMLWGGSFLFMRMGAAEFGPVVLSALRLIGASMLLMPLLLWRGQWAALRLHWRPIFVVGVTNSALPFVCFAYAALSVSAFYSIGSFSIQPIWFMDYYFQDTDQKFSQVFSLTFAYNF